MAKTFHVMSRHGLWWTGKEWVKDPIPGSSNLRQFKTVRRMINVFNGVEGQCSIHAHYYVSKKRGARRGWREQWYMEKGGSDG